MNRIAVVVGLSCSGKDFILESLSKDFPVPIFNFGRELYKELYKKFPALRSSDEIRSLSFADINEAVISLDKRLVACQPLVLSAHTVVRTVEGLVVSTQSNEILDPVAYLHVSSPPQEIVRRRQRNNRFRNELSETVSTVSFHQDLSEFVTARLAFERGAIFTKIWNQEGHSYPLSRLNSVLKVLN